MRKVAPVRTAALQVTRSPCYTESVLRNVTITLDEETAHWARVQAAHRNLSVSRFVKELLETQMRADESYERAMTSYLARPSRALSSADQPYPSRDELHDRAGLR